MFVDWVCQFCHSCFDKDMMEARLVDLMETTYTYEISSNLLSKVWKRFTKMLFQSFREFPFFFLHRNLMYANSAWASQEYHCNKCKESRKVCTSSISFTIFQIFLYRLIVSPFRSDVNSKFRFGNNTGMNTTCSCSGQYVGRLDKNDLLQVIGVLRGIAKPHNLAWLNESLDNYTTMLGATVMNTNVWS